MPFPDDTGVRLEDHRGPLLSAFATLWDQVERMVMLNVAWAIHLLPLLGAVGFPELPRWLRIGMIAYSALAIAPATGVLFGALWQACDQELLSVELVRETLRRVGVASYTRLAPLYSLFVWLSLLALWAARRDLFVLDTVARLLFLLLGVCAMYWGPIFAEDPDRSLPAIVRRSVAVVLRYPLPSLLLSIGVVLALTLGLISVGGIFLVVPVLVALLQIQHYKGSGLPG